MGPRRRLLSGAVVGTALLIATVAGCGSDKGGSAAPKLSAAGKEGLAVAKDQGCVACHTDDGRGGTGPTWKGLAGSTVTLANGKTVVADDDYLRTAIVDPRSQVVKGYSNFMPIFDHLSKAEVADLIDYLHDLAPAPTN